MSSLLFSSLLIQDNAETERERVENKRRTLRQSLHGEKGFASGVGEIENGAAAILAG